MATTNIGEKVNKMEITVANKTEVDQVLVSNEVQINKYRVLLYFLVIFSFYLILFEREFLEKKLEIFFPYLCVVVWRFSDFDCRTKICDLG